MGSRGRERIGRDGPEHRSRVGALRHRIRRTIGLAVVTGLAGCSVSGPGGAGGGAVSPGGGEGAERAGVDRAAGFDRGAPPSVGSPPSMRVLEREVFELSNGLPVHVVEDHDLPMVSVELHVAGGGRVGTPGLGPLLADMLDEGTTTRSAVELAEAIERIGASLSTGADHDGSVIRLGVLRPHLERALELLGDVVRNPAFDEAELDRVKRQRVTRILQSRDEPRELADNALADRLYQPGSSYGQPLLGTEAALRPVDRGDLVALYERTFGADNMSVVVVGDVDRDELEERLEGALGSLPAAAAVDFARQVPRALDGPAIYVVDKPGAPQSEIRIGRVAVARGTPDYFPLMVMNTILGGSFTSRLNANLREDKGYTYGAGSGFSMRREPGPFVAAAAVNTSVTDKAVVEFLRELRRLADEPVGEVELDRARKYLALRLPQRFETVAGTAAQVADQVLNDLGDDYHERYVERVLAVTAGDVRRVAREYLDPDEMVVVVAGDHAAIRGGLEELGWGAVTLIPEPTVTDAPPGPDRSGSD